MKFKPLFIFLYFFSSVLFAQEESEGYLQFIGHNFYNDKPLTQTQIKVLSDGQLFQTHSTGNSKDFKLELPYGHIYEIHFQNMKTQPMFLQVIANTVPVKKQNLLAKYDLNIPFFPKHSESMDTAQFAKPFHQIVFDGKNKFVDDTAYMNRFIKNLFTLPKKETVTSVVTPPTVQKANLVGQLFADSKERILLSNKSVTLLDKEGKDISKTVTTKTGVFIFRGVNPDEVSGIRIEPDSTNGTLPVGILLKNTSGETLEKMNNPSNNNAITIEKSPTNDIVNRLIDNVFEYKIAGKIALTDGQDKKIMSDKYVYLLNDKDEVVQKTKTNVLGNFLFTGIKPDQNYAVAIDDADCDFDQNCKAIFYNTKDKKLRVVDSILKNRFNYKFLAVSGSSFNDLLVDDIDLKMNVKGRVFGDNTNNPITNTKIFLMNDQYEVIDTALTDDKGAFIFKSVPYNKEFMISMDNKNSMLDVFNNILVYDNDNNMVKIVSMIRGNKFKYKPLKTEKSRITEIYVDDPWLKTIDKNFAKNNKVTQETIIENILFKFNSYEIESESQQTLDKVYLALRANPNLKIELGAHTDSKGSDSYNLKLSENRAKSAKDYLVKKGIDANRIKSVGYGETKLLNHCDNNTPCSDEEHARNRRLEFKLNFN